MGCARAFFDKDTGESTGWMCGPGVVPCCICGALAFSLCDFPMGQGKTCDAPLCPNHAIAQRPFPQNRLRVAADEEAEEAEEADWIEFCPQHHAIVAGGVVLSPKPTQRGGLFDEDSDPADLL